MAVKKIHYETVLSDYSSAQGAIALLKQYRPYLEMLPSMRRPEESLITIPLPVITFRNSTVSSSQQYSTGVSESRCLSCDIALLMCDPEWKIKTGVEIFVFIHQPHEDFSDLLSRWRQTQVCLSRGYEWSLPLRYKHILNEGADNVYPLFVLFAETPDRIKKGLKGAFLPFVIQTLDVESEDNKAEELPVQAPETLWADNRDLLG
jgi:hypothetical protein